MILPVRYGFRDGGENPRGADGLLQGAQPSECPGAVINRSSGERQSLVMRMGGTAGARLFRKDWEARPFRRVALHHCNLASIRMTLRRSHAMAAGIADKPWPIADIAAPIDAAEKSD
jgi:hypothetical protein